MFSLICAWINGWVNTRGAGDLGRHRAHYDLMVMGNASPMLAGTGVLTHWGGDNMFAILQIFFNVFQIFFNENCCIVIFFY